MLTDEPKLSPLEAFRARVRAGEFRKKPAPLKVVSVPVSDRMADAVRANPESLRLTANGADDVSVVERPISRFVTPVIHAVPAVDEDGRPIWPRAGAVHEYDPFERL